MTWGRLRERTRASHAATAPYRGVRKTLRSWLAWDGWRSSRLVDREYSGDGEDGNARPSTAFVSIPFEGVRHAPDTQAVSRFRRTAVKSANGVSSVADEIASPRRCAGTVGGPLSGTYWLVDDQGVRFGTSGAVLAGYPLVTFGTRREPSDVASKGVLDQSTQASAIT